MFRLEKAGFFEKGPKWKEEKYERQSSKNEDTHSGLNKTQEKKLEELLIKAFNCSSSFSEKEIVLVLGATGSGKSTTTCYLVGCEMGEDDNGKIAVKDAKGHDYPEIGMKVDSQTLFPKIFETEAKIDSNKTKTKINLSDCPGFGDNRSMPEKICTFVSTQAAINAAASIKSIIIFIEYGSFFVQHGEGLRKLLEILSHLFCQPGNLKESVMFIITKTADIKPEVVQKRMFNQKIELQTSIREKLNQMKKESKGSQGKDEPTAKEKEEIAHLSGTLEVLSLIEKSNTIFIDPLDNGNSRREIFKILLNLKKVDRDQFRFNFYDDHHLMFKRFIFKIARNGYRVCENILEANYEMKRCMQEIKHIELSHASHTNTLDKLKYDLKQLEVGQLRNVGSDGKAAEFELTQSITTCNDEIKRLTLEKTALELGQTDWGRELVELKNELDHLEKDNLERYWYDFLDKRGIFWSEKEFKYKAEPYDKVIENHNGSGKFYVFCNDKEKGVYTSTYKSNFFTRGDASVEILLKRRNLPQNKERIEDINKRINLLNSHIDQALKEIKTQLTVLTERRNNLSEALSKIQLQQNTIEQTTNSMKNAIGELMHLRKSEESYMNKLNERYESNLKELKNNQTDLEKELQSYQLVINSQATIQFNAAIVEDFTLKYFQVSGLFPHLFTKISPHAVSSSTAGSTSSTSSDSLPSSASRYSSTDTDAPISTSSSSSRLTTTKNRFTRG